ncbi:hypothetical protein SBOR_5203 [Sclerotinia borealis F-4128]|uniref:Tat pathway signal sequence n=1 Tax=Sclerotinia borealis (strain F-4128) TaxID=1432307 RepID=W9CIR3_SCLBF|nr:hypothetical protein SBOR_5203 [Sclerotinia borealis F-4128]
MEALYKKLRSARISTSGQRPLYKDESSNEDLSTSSEGLLESKDDESVEFDVRPRKHKRRSFIWAVVAHSFIFATYTIGLFAARDFFSQRPGPPTLVYTPAADALKYEKVFYNGTLFAGSLYKGDPRPELDLAWHNLVKNNNLRISKEELEKLDRTALPLADGSGYYAQLNVYHHLHCLKFMREAFYADYYPDAQGPTTKMHVDHCIDDIRQALMCHADTSITTFEWEEGIRRPMPDFAGWHTCNNWQVLDDWATSRAFSMFDQKSLINPTYGIAFPLVDGQIDYTPPSEEGFRAVWPGDKEHIVSG